eukprot:TCONS_00066488-protein
MSPNNTQNTFSSARLQQQSFQDQQLNITSPTTISLHEIEMIENVTVWIQLFSIVFSFIGNFLIIFGTCQIQRLTLNKMVINYLAICDLMYSFLQIFMVHRKFYGHRWYFGSFICILTTLSPCAISTSFFIITFISYERYRSIMYPLQVRLGRLKITFFIFIIFVCSLTLHFPFFIHMEIYNENGFTDCAFIWHAPLKKYWIALVFVLTYPVPILIFLYCYVNIIIKVSGRSHKSMPLRRNIHTKNKKLCITLATIVVVFVVTTSPNQILILWENFGNTNAVDARQTYVILYSLSSLIHLHAFANPIIYSFTDAKFRQVLCFFKQSKEKLRKTIMISMRRVEKPDTHHQALIILDEPHVIEGPLLMKDLSL